MQHNSEVSSSILQLHLVERMRHTNQVGVKSTWSSPEEHQICTLDCSQSRSAPSLRIRLLVATQCVHSRWRVQLVENKNETTLEPTTVYRSQIQEFGKKVQVACHQDSVGSLLIVCSASALNFHLEQLARNKKLDEFHSFQECWD